MKKGRGLSTQRPKDGHDAVVPENYNRLLPTALSKSYDGTTNPR